VEVLLVFGGVVGRAAARVARRMVGRCIVVVVCRSRELVGGLRWSVRFFPDERCEIMLSE
jgi:hypothetical protein